MATPRELIDRLASDDAGVRAAAADGLYELGAIALPSMIEAVRHLEPASPQHVHLHRTFQRLGQVAFAPVRDALAVARTDEERSALAWILSGLGESALPGLISALQDRRPEIRRQAIFGIARLEEEARLSAVPALTALIGAADERSEEQALATATLTGMGVAAVPMLQEIRVSGAPRARHAALRCLAEIGGEAVLSSRDRRALERLIRIKLIHDHPLPVIACFLSWIAVSTTDQKRVMELFGLKPIWPATFQLGISAADSDAHGRALRPQEDLRHLGRVFVAPPLNGWTLIFGPWCCPWLERRDETLELCIRASSVFGKAQAYWYGEQDDGSVWLVAENGVLIRRGANVGDEQDAELALGEPLPEEVKALAAEKNRRFGGTALFDFAPKLARRRSINPRRLTAATPFQGHGWLALTPIGVTHGTLPGALQISAEPDRILTLRSSFRIVREVAVALGHHLLGRLKDSLKLG